MLFRLSYGVWLIEQLLQDTSENVKTYMMYDIACKLVSHLKASGSYSAGSDRLNLVIPSFHAYGHSADCQVKYN